MRRFVIVLALAGVCALAVFAGGAAAATVTPVTSGLDSPRGLAFLANGTLAVAEAGHGGDVCLGPGAPCFGLTSQISTINLATGTHTPLVSGLISLLDPAGGALGVDGLSVQGERLLGVIGANPVGLDHVSCAGLPPDCATVISTAEKQLGQLFAVSGGQAKPFAGVGAFDYDFTLDHPGGDVFGEEIDSNPYGVLAMPGGAFVADAGANTLDWVGNSGHISILNRYPVPHPHQPFPTDAVPTCIAQGAGGLTVGDLAGRIWQLHAGSWQILSQQADMRHFTGCAADAAGNVYFVSMFSGLFPTDDDAFTGSIVKLATNGSITRIADELMFPNGIAVGPDHKLYISTGSICPATPGGACGPLTGGVVKITP